MNCINGIKTMKLVKNDQNKEMPYFLYDVQECKLMYERTETKICMLPPSVIQSPTHGRTVPYTDKQLYSTRITQSRCYLESGIR